MVRGLPVRRRRRGHEFEVQPAVEDVVEHAEEVALLEDGVAGGAAEAVDVEQTVASFHD